MAMVAGSLPQREVFDSDSQFEAQLWQQVLYQATVVTVQLGWLILAIAQNLWGKNAQKSWWFQYFFKIQKVIAVFALQALVTIKII
jgi:hypothetical protein